MSDKISMNIPLPPHNNVTKIQIPTKPKTLKPSSLQGYYKAVSFKPYITNNPALLHELNDIISFGISSINNVDSFHDILVLEVYQNAFQRFIEDFGIYRPFLETVKNEYDKIVNLYVDHLESQTDLEYERKEYKNQFIVKQINTNVDET